MSPALYLSTCILGLQKRDQLPTQRSISLRSKEEMAFCRFSKDDDVCYCMLCFYTDRNPQRLCIIEFLLTTAQPQAGRSPGRTKTCGEKENCLNYVIAIGTAVLSTTIASHRGHAAPQRRSTLSTIKSRAADTASHSYCCAAASTDRSANASFTIPVRCRPSSAFACR